MAYPANTDPWQWEYAPPRSSRGPARTEQSTSSGRRSQTADEVAASRVDAILNPQLEALARWQAEQERRYMADLAEQQRRTEAYSLAAAQFLQGVGPQVQSGYQQVAQRTDNYAKGFSIGLQAAASGNADELNKLLAQQGSPQQVQSQGQAAADVLFGTQGYIPARSFEEQGAAFGAAASMLPASQLAQGRQTMLEAQREHDKNLRDLRSEFEGKRMDVLGSRGGLIQQALSDIRANNLKRQELVQTEKAAEAQAAKDERDFSFKVALAEREFGLKEGELALRLRSQGFNEKATQARIDNEAARIANEGARLQAQIDRDLRAAGIQDEKLAQGWAALEIRARQAGKKKGGKRTLTAKQRADFNATAASIAEGAYNGLEATEDEEAAPPIGYQEALREMYKEGIPLAIAQAALNRFYRRGERGRPQVSFQDRQRRRRASRRQSRGARNAPR